MDWPHWLPFILLAYRSRIHSTTQTSPFRLMFGREINTFEDWRISPNELEAAELLKRSIMIKRQYEVEIPQTLKTIEKAQEKQKKNQDKRSNVTKTELVDGDKVFVKIS